MKTLLFLLSSVAFAAAPTITSGPGNYDGTNCLGKYTYCVNWVTSATGGSSTTTTNTLSQVAIGTEDSLGVASGQGANYPAGSVVKVDHERMQVRTQVGDALTVYRGYDQQSVAPYLTNLSNITVSGGGINCRANFPGSVNASLLYAVGDTIQVVRAATITNTPQVVTAVTSSAVDFLCTGTDAVYTEAGMQMGEYPSAHSSGATISRIDSDSAFCVGTSTGTYTLSFYSPTAGSLNYRQSTNHFVAAVALTPGTHYFAKVMSTSNGVQTNCASPGGNTVQSSEFTFDTPAATAGDQIPIPPASPLWDFSSVLCGGVACTWTTDVLISTNCTDLQTAIDAAAVANGNLNYRIRVLESLNISCNAILRNKTGSNPTGTGKLIVVSSGYASLPAEGLCLTDTNTVPTGGACKSDGTVVPQPPTSYLSHVPTLYTSTPSVPAISVAPSAHHWIVRGIAVGVDPGFNSSGWGADTPVITDFSGNSSDYDVNQDPHHIAFDQIYISCPVYNNFCKGSRLHGKYQAFMDSYISPCWGSNDQAGIQYDGLASQYIYPFDNFVSCSFSSIYFSDNSINPSDVTVKQNYAYKPETLNDRSAEYLKGASQAVSSVATGATPTVTTSKPNDVFSGTPAGFRGGTGSFVALNYKTFSTVAGTTDFTCVSGTCTMTTSSPHGLTTGDLGFLGGGHTGLCAAFNTGDNPASVLTVAGANTVTFAYAGADFSTVSGNQCPQSDLKVYAPVFAATNLSSSTFSITKNTTGFTGTAPTAIDYPHARDTKNAMEAKTIVRALYTGNVLNGSPSEAQSGHGWVFSVRGTDYFGGWPIGLGPCLVCALTIRDVDVDKNIILNACNTSSKLGQNTNGPTSPMYRVRFSNIVGFNIAGNNAGTGTCGATPMSWLGSYNDDTYEKSTIQATDRVINEDDSASSAFPTSGKLYLDSNIIQSSSLMSSGNCTAGGMIAGLGCASVPSYVSADWKRNVYYGSAALVGSADPWNFARQFMSGVTTGSSGLYTDSYWANSQCDVGFVGALTVTNAINAHPVVLTTSTAHGLTGGDIVFVDGISGTTSANNIWYVGAGSAGSSLALASSIGNGVYSGGGCVTAWKGAQANLANVTLSGTSPYKGGTTYIAPAPPPVYGTPGQGGAVDNAKDVGADMAAVLAAVTGSAPVTTGNVMRGVIFRGVFK